ncbi:MAG TPA: glycosyl hydrolase family 28 protein [Longimicrobiaceae bacterium]|nr:glycosyl hydrolase family 28 protein [Longimicrobiaceae bacterium]
MPEGRHSRRDFLRGAAAAGAMFVLPGSLVGCGTGSARRAGASPLGTVEDRRGWDLVPEILSRIRPPVFPNRDFPVTAYGAVGDGATDGSEAFREAIAACHRAGGGRVVVPAGRFLTGPVHLRSNVELHLSEGATLLFSTDPEDYLPAVFTRYEGIEIMGYSPLIYVFEQENVAITGTGTLDGQASNEHWWPRTGRPERGWREGMPIDRPEINRMGELAEAGVPVEQRVFGEGSNLRPQFIQPYRCRNVLIEGVTIHNSPMWQVNPVLCENVTVRGLRIISHGPNNDGCNPESCRDVLIEDCYFDTGDDCIAIKSGRNADGRRVNTPSENVVIRRCRMKDGHGGVVFGSEISGGVRNVFAEECVMDSPRLQRAIRFKTNSVRGGFFDNIYVRNITVGEVREAVLLIDFHYQEGDSGPFKPEVRNVELRNVTSQKSRYALLLRGFHHTPIAGVRLIDCRFENVQEGNRIEHVEGLELHNVVINGRQVRELASTL